jgi:4-diphosphocytidyl-2C-methyl-D-erythritol kinase
MYSDGSATRALAGALGRSPARIAASLYNGMEGAAATVFGVARSYEQARQIRARVARGSWECWAVRTLTGPAVRLVANGARRG